MCLECNIVSRENISREIFTTGIRLLSLDAVSLSQESLELFFGRDYYIGGGTLMQFPERN